MPEIIVAHVEGTQLQVVREYKESFMHKRISVSSSNIYCERSETQPFPPECQRWCSHLKTKVDLNRLRIAPSEVPKSHLQMWSMEILCCLKYQVRAESDVLKFFMSFKKEGTRACFTGSVPLPLNLSYADSVSTEIYFLPILLNYPCEITVRSKNTWNAY